MERVKSSNHSTRGEGDNCIYTVTSFVVNWSFSNIDSEMERTHSRIQNAEEKDEYDNDSVKSFR